MYGEKDLKCTFSRMWIEINYYILTLLVSQSVKDKAQTKGIVPKTQETYYFFEERNYKRITTFYLRKQRAQFSFFILAHEYNT